MTCDDSRVGACRGRFEFRPAQGRRQERLFGGSCVAQHERIVDAWARMQKQGFFFGPTSLFAFVALTSLLPSTKALALDDGDALRVVGGGPAKDCAWPSVVYLNTTTSLKQPGMCTGTLIHPRVILYAAHCGTLNHFRFGKDPIEPAHIYKKETIEKSGTHPGYKHVQNVEVDWAYALLKKPVKDVPVVPVSFGCELDQVMKTGQRVELVGFSPNTKKGHPRPKAEVGNYAKRRAQTTITSLSEGRLVLRESGKHVCEGDSGGPLMARLPKGGWRTVGIASIMTGGDCKDASVYSSYARVRRKMVEWIEKETGVDVTPCYDLDGKPTPSAACDRFMAFNDDPASPKGTWDKMCSEAPSAKVMDACGVEESGEEPEEKNKDGDEDSDEKDKDKDGEKDKDSDGEKDGDKDSDEKDKDKDGEKDKGKSGKKDKGKKKDKDKGKKKGKEGDEDSEADEDENGDEDAAAAGTSKKQDKGAGETGGCAVSQPSGALSLGAIGLLLGLLTRRRKGGRL